MDLHLVSLQIHDVFSFCGHWFFFFGGKNEPQNEQLLCLNPLSKVQIASEWCFTFNEGTRAEHRDVLIVRGDTVVEFTTSDSKTRAGIIYGGLSQMSRYYKILCVVTSTLNGKYETTFKTSTASGHLNDWWSPESHLIVVFPSCLATWSWTLALNITAAFWHGITRSLYHGHKAQVTGDQGWYMDQ